MSIFPEQLSGNLGWSTEGMSSLLDSLPSLTFWLARLDPKDTDVIAQFQDSFNHFVKTGQVWALLIGLVVGYMFKSLTSS